MTRSNMRSKLTLITLSDGKSIDASRKSIEGFIKYNGNNVIAVNTQHSVEFEKMCQGLGVNVYTPYKKFGYPSFPKEQYDDHVEFFYTTILRPAMMAETEYIIFSEPDCIFNKTIDRNILDGSDIIVPTDRSSSKVMWAFQTLWIGYGVNDEERLKNINLFFDSLRDICKNVNLDFDKASKNDMRFCFMANSIIKTDRIIQFYTREREAVTYLMQNITALAEKYRSKDDRIQKVFSNFCINFSPDQIFSIIFGLYLFKWKVNENGQNCNAKDFKTEDDLKNFLNRYPDTEYIHSCKLYYNK